MIKTFFTVLVFFYFSGIGYSQIADTVQTVQPNLEIEKVKVQKHKTKWPDPKKAILFSIIPGGGQIYNKRFWKAPIVYGAFAVNIYFITTSRKSYLEFSTALNLARQGLPNDFPGANLTVLKGNRDIANKNMQQSYLVGIGIYLLQATEAFVDAHLRDFDVSEDLSMTIKPSFEYTALNHQPILGLSVNIPIN